MSNSQYQMLKWEKVSVLASDNEAIWLLGSPQPLSSAPAAAQGLFSSLGSRSWSLSGAEWAAVSALGSNL